MLTFFERSPLDQVLKNDNVHKIQPSFQSPVKISGKSFRERPGEMLLGLSGSVFRAWPVRWGTPPRPGLRKVLPWAGCGQQR